MILAGLPMPPAMTPAKRPVSISFVSGAAWLLLAVFAVGCTTMRSAGPPPEPVRAVASDPAFTAAADLARNDAGLSGDARTANAREIDRLLSTLDDAVLARDSAALTPGHPLYNFAGRALMRRGLPLPRPFDRGGQWRFDAGVRPPADRDGYRPPVKLAVLLPLSGSLAKAAAPVRDGLLAGYYGETRRRPDIDFIDTQGTAAGALAGYAKAVDGGADFVLGPLGRDEVGALFREPSLTVPVLALNRGSAAPPAGSASFSLAPEDEGLAAAEYLLGRNARRALVLVGTDESLRRSANAFRERFAERGGTMVDSLSVADAKSDLAAALAAAAQKPGGVDAVFMALNPEVARAIALQLGAARLNATVRVGTSQLAREQAGAGGLDGIAYPLETAAPVSGAGRLPTASGAGARLFAFGHDAWLLVAYLEHLAVSGGELRGATGVLRIDGFGNVQRTPTWSVPVMGTTPPPADGGR